MLVATDAVAYAILVAVVEVLRGVVDSLLMAKELWNVALVVEEVDVEFALIVAFIIGKSLAKLEA